jgi:polysaccharide export outer membrane protein
MRSALLLFFAGIMLLSSCVPNKKYLYMQKNDFPAKQPANDSVIARNYTLKKFDYKLQTNDIVSIRYQSLTTKEFDFLGQQQNVSGSGAGMGMGTANYLLIGDVIDDNGEIPMPVVGKVKVGGLTIFEAQDKIQALANQYLESPVVKVRLLNYRAMMLGEVKKEGDLVFSNNRVSLLEAVAMAGGLGELADRANIKVIRQNGASAEVHYVNLLKEDFITSPFYYIHQNDVIIVPPLRQRPYRMYFGQNLSVILSSVSVFLLVLTLNRK